MAKRGLAVILGLYLALAAGYGAVTPFGQPPDETAHALYVQHLVEKRSLPVLRRARRAAYEFHQPPLYYLLASPAWALGSLVSPAAANGAARGVSILIGALGIGLIAALAWSVVPGEGAAREALALTAAGFAALLPMRLATAASVSNDTLAEAVFTAGLLLMTQMLRFGMTIRRAALLGVVLGLGILTKSSDLLLFPVALVALLLAAQTGGARGQGSGARGQGLDDGEETTTKARARTEGSRLAPGPRPLAPGRFFRHAALAFGLALLVGGGWMVRNARLYGDPLGTKAFEQYFSDTPTPAMWGQLLGYNLLDVLWRKDVPLTFDSFWGVFGHMQYFMGAYPRDSEPPGWAFFLADHGYPPASCVYPLLLVVTLAAAGGLGVQAFRRSGVQAFRRSGVQAFRRSGDGEGAGEHPESQVLERQILVLALGWFLVLAAFVRFNLVFFQAQGRYLFPAMGPSALGLAAGWLAWWPARRRSLGAGLLLAGLLALALYALFGTLLPAFSGH